MRKVNYLLSTKETACLASACVSALEENFEGTSPLELFAETACHGFKVRVPETKVNKAIEEHAVAVSKKGKSRVLPDAAVLYVAYTSLATATGLTLSRKTKVDLFRWMSDFRNRLAHGEDTSGCSFKLGPMTEIKPEGTIEHWVKLIDSYCSAKESFILEDPKIMGGLPVIRGSRITVYSVLNRLEGGDSLEEIMEENSDIPSEAFEAAVLYACSHPRKGRPKGGRRFR